VAEELIGGGVVLAMAKGVMTMHCCPARQGEVVATDVAGVVVVQVLDEDEARARREATPGVRDQP
jgi:ornithine carbamoyltransferase